MCSLQKFVNSSVACEMCYYLSFSKTAPHHKTFNHHQHKDFLPKCYCF